MTPRAAAAVASLALLGLWHLVEPAAAVPGLRTGFIDPSAYEELSQAERAQAMRRIRAARGSVVRVIVYWRRVGPRKPPSRAAARDHRWRGYDWRSTDRSVQDATGEGIKVLLTVLAAPDWAEGPGRPSVSRIEPGAWKPSPRAYGDFMTAAARRYSGRTSDPTRPGVRLSRVRLYQAWNEPNLEGYLAPQYVFRLGQVLAYSPGHYRRLLNALYGAVNRVRRTNIVVTAGTAPFGDLLRGGRRIPPAAFVRELLCVKGVARPQARRCTRSPARFDVLAHHPFSIFGPTRPALNPDDVSPPDMRKLTRPLAAAVRAGTARPRRRKEVWATEVLYGDSRPPDPEGIPQARHARFLAGALYVLWRRGVDVALLLQVRDSPPRPSFARSLQAGLYERGANLFADRPKPALTAFRFPFTAYRQPGRSVLWGIAPRPGFVAIDAFRGGRWIALMPLRAGRNRVFFRRAAVRTGRLLRARQGAETSLPWRT